MHDLITNRINSNPTKSHLGNSPPTFLTVLLNNEDEDNNDDDDEDNLCLSSLTVCVCHTESKVIQLDIYLCFFRFLPLVGYYKIVNMVSYATQYVYMCSVSSVVSEPLRPSDCSPPESSVHGILQARILEWVAMPSSRGYSQPRDRTMSPAEFAQTHVH